MQTEIPIPEQPVQTCKFKRGEEVWFLRPNGVRRVKATVVEHYDFRNSYRIADSIGECVVEESDILSTSEMLFESNRKKREAERKEMNRLKEKLADVVEMWNFGFRTPKEMSACRGGPAVKWHNQIKACKRLGFIS